MHKSRSLEDVQRGVAWPPAQKFWEAPYIINGNACTRSRLARRVAGSRLETLFHACILCDTTTTKAIPGVPKQYTIK